MKIFIWFMVCLFSVRIIFNCILLGAGKLTPEKQKEHAIDLFGQILIVIWGICALQGATP